MNLGIMNLGIMNLGIMNLGIMNLGLGIMNLGIMNLGIMNLGIMNLGIINLFRSLLNFSQNKYFNLQPYPQRANNASSFKILFINILIIYFVPKPNYHYTNEL